MKNKIKILSLLLIITSCSTQEDPVEHIIRESKYLMDRNNTEIHLEGGTWTFNEGHFKYQFSYDAVKGKWIKSYYYKDLGKLTEIKEQSYQVIEDFWGPGMHWFNNADDTLPIFLVELVRIDKDTYRRYLRMFDVNDPDATPDYTKMKRACEVTGETFSPDFWKRTY